MKKVTLFIALIVFSIVGNAQTSSVAGSWLLTRAEIDDQVQEPMQIADFKDDGKMEVLGMEMGTWKYNEEKKTIDMTSEFDKDFAGENKVIALNDTEMVLEKGNTKLFYVRIDPDKIQQDNQASGLEGTWKIQTEYESMNILTLELPDSFTLVESEEGMTSTSRGTWIYDPSGEMIAFVGLRNIISGNNKITLHTATNLELENNGTKIIAEKMKSGANKIESLDFTEADFYNEDGDFKYYEDEEKLPWLDAYDKIMSMTNVNQLVYNYSTMIGGTSVFNSKTLTADVSASDEEQSLSIDYIFYGYDRYNLPDDTELPPNSDYTSPLFPLKDLDFRIAGREQITTPAGTFDCTVLEAVNYSGVSIKLWLIDNKPGIYAKIIEDDTTGDDHYIIYELLEIR